MKTLAIALTALFTLTLFSPMVSQAQNEVSNVLDGIYEKKIHKEKQIIPYEHIRESATACRSTWNRGKPP